MVAPFILRPLRAERITEAFGLIAIIDPSITPENWARYASAYVVSEERDSPRGILAIRNGLDVIFGLSAYQIRNDIRRGRILELENLAVVDPLGSSLTGSKFFEALEGFARDNLCHCVVVSFLHPSIHKRFRMIARSTNGSIGPLNYRSEPIRVRKCFY